MINMRLLFLLIISTFGWINVLAQSPECTGAKTECEDIYPAEEYEHNSSPSSESFQPYVFKIMKGTNKYPHTEKENIYYCIQAAWLDINRAGKCREVYWYSFGTMFCDINGNFVRKTSITESYESKLEKAITSDNLYFTLFLQDFSMAEDFTKESLVLKVIFAELNDEGTDFKEGAVDIQTFCVTDGWFGNSNFEGLITLGSSKPADLTLTATNLFEPEESVEETPELLDFLLYPNPVEKGNSVLLTLNCPEDSLSGVLIEVYDHTGKCVLKKDAEGRDVSIDGLKASGIYFIRVISPDGVIKTKRVQVK